MDEASTTTAGPDRAPAELLDVHAVANMLGASAGYIRELSHAGLMPGSVKLGTLVRWSRRGLLRWIDAGCPPLHAPPDRSDDGENRDSPHLPPSRVKARAAYEWALKNIPGAARLTYPKLFKAILLASESLPDLGDSMPPNATAFQKYVNDTGVRKQVHRNAIARQVGVATNSSEVPQ